jgi:aspartate/glutamate racemase
MSQIKAVKSGDTGAKVQAALARTALQLADQADVLLIGCSELSVIAAEITAPFVDSLDVQAEAIVAFSSNG